MNKINQLDFKNFLLRKFIVDKDEIDLYKSLRHPSVVRHMATNGFTLEDCTQIVIESLEHWKNHNIGSWCVEVEESIAGWAGFKQWKEEEFEILVVLSPAYWSLGRKIFGELIKLASREFGLAQVFILLPETRKSFEFVKKIGFRYVKSEIFNGALFHKFVLIL